MDAACASRRARSGEALGRIIVWSPSSDFAKRPRMRESDDWRVDSWVEVDIVEFNDKGEFYLALVCRVGPLVHMLDCPIRITIIAGD